MSHEAERRIPATIVANLTPQPLVTSPNTASNHIEHIYAKISASSRAAAALFAMQHGLLPEEEPAATDVA